MNQEDETTNPLTGHAAVPAFDELLSVNSDGTSDNGGGESQQPHRRRRRMSREHIKRIKRRRRIRRILIAVGVVLLALVALGALFVNSVVKTKNEVNAAVQSASGLQTKILSGDTDGVDAQLQQFTQHVDAAYAETSSVLWGIAARTPYFGNDVTAVQRTVTAMENLSTQALPQLKSVLGVLSFNDVSISNGTITVPGLSEAANALQSADSTIGKAVNDLNGLPTMHIGMVSDGVNKAKDYLQELYSTVHSASAIAQLAPSMLGNDGSTRTYLILAETNSELRSTGGIPGSWGTVTVTNGTVNLQQFVPDSALNTLDEPIVTLTSDEKAIFGKNLGTKSQDVNFTPDFPRTGEIAKAMWNNTYQQDVDGVIAMDPVFLQNMLAVTGGVTMEDGVTLDGTNTADYLLHQVYVDKAVSEQDSYFSAAAAATFGHIMQNAGDAKAYVKALTESVQGGHLLMWSAHENEQKLLEELPVAGQLKTNASDPEIGVYFSDGTQSKMDWYLKREVSVESDGTAANGARQYTVTITLSNTMDPNEVASTPAYILGDLPDGVQPGQIKTITYLYAPAQGRLVDWTMSDDSQFDMITTHEGLTLGAKDITLSPGESYRIVAHVQASPGVKADATLRQTPLVESKNQ